MKERAQWLATRLGLFGGAYAPLALIFGLRTSNWWFLVAGVSAAYLWFVLFSLKSVGTQTQEFKNIEDQGAQVSGYLATYLLPFLMSTTPTGWRDYGAYAVYFFIVFVIFVRSDMILVNPTLYIYGWRIYRVSWIKTKHESVNVLLITRKERSQIGKAEAIDLGGLFVIKRE